MKSDPSKSSGDEKQQPTATLRQAQGPRNEKRPFDKLRERETKSEWRKANGEKRTAKSEQRKANGELHPDAEFCDLAVEGLPGNIEENSSPGFVETRLCKGLGDHMGFNCSEV